MARKRLPQLLAGKNVRPNCEVCDANNWQLPPDESAEIRISVIEPNGAFSLPGPSFNAHFMICYNCGNVRIHASQIIEPTPGARR